MGELVGGDSPISDIPGDSTLVIAGPPMTGKYALMLAVLARNTDETIVITTKNAASRILEDFEKEVGDREHGRLGVVDCVTRPEGLPDRETDLIKHAGSPENLTRIGVKFTELFELFYDANSEASVGVGLHAISQLLMHSDLKSVYQFLQVLTGQVRSADWLCVAVVDTNVGEEELQTLYHHFDGIIQTRENPEGRRELRVRGLSPTSTDWSTF